MATRQEIIAGARKIIATNPTSGKSKINEYLRLEYGVGLRSSTILEIKQQIARERPELRPELYARGSVPVSLRSSFNTLLKSGLTRWEAREFATNYTSSDFKNLSYVKNMLRWRRLYVGNLRYRGYTNKQISDKIKELYKKQGWLTIDNALNPWKMLRYFRKKDIETGEYIPRKRVFRDASGNIRRIIIAKGDVDEQRQRARERQKEIRANDEEAMARYQEQRRAQRARARAREQH